MSIQPVNKAVWGAGAGGGGAVNAYLMKNSRRQTETETDRQRQTDGQRLFSCFTKTRSLWCVGYSSDFFVCCKRPYRIESFAFCTHLFFFLVVLAVTEQPLSLSPCSGNALVHLLSSSVVLPSFCRPPSTRPATLVFRNVDQSN